jgi:hypothetical protein
MMDKNSVFQSPMSKFLLAKNRKTDRAGVRAWFKRYSLSLKVAAIILSIILLFSSQYISNHAAGDDINLSSSPQRSEKSNEPLESSLLFGKGPFEVSGDPASYAAAWIDQDQNGKDVLNIALFEGNQIPLIHQISSNVDSQENIFLKKDQERIALTWKEGNGWHLGMLEILKSDRQEESYYNFQETIVKLNTTATPLCLSLKDEKIAFILIPKQGNSIGNAEEILAPGTLESSRNAYDRMIDPIDIPSIDKPALLEIDFINFEPRVVHHFDETVSSAVLSYRSGSWGVAYRESLSSNLKYIEIDSLGNPVISEWLNNFPIPDIIPSLREFGDRSFLGWIEVKLEQNAAILGLLERSDSTAYLTTQEISSIDASSFQMTLSQGSTTWTAWSEKLGEERQLKIATIDQNGNLLCPSEISYDDATEKFWILGSGTHSLLFKQKISFEGKKSLTVQAFHCDELGASKDSESPQGDAASLHDMSSQGQQIYSPTDPPSESQSPLGGGEDPCDGFDNDSDGTIDEGCDQTCDNPEKWGSDSRITNDSSISDNSSLVWIGSEYGLAWEDDRDGNLEIYFTRIDTEGNKIGSETRITSNSAISEHPSMVWTGSEYAVCWDDTRNGNTEIYFTRIDSTGVKIGSDVRVTSNSASSQYSSLIWTGSEYGVSWRDNRDGNWEIYFARLNSAGAKISSEIRVTNDAESSLSPSLVWTGTEYAISWYDFRDGNYEIYLARLNSSGTKIGSDIRVTSDPAQSAFPSLVWTGDEFGISWHDQRDGNDEIYFARLNFLGAKIGFDERITSDAGNSNQPVMVWTGSEYGVSWIDDRDGNDEIYLTRIDATGNELGTDARLTYDAANSFRSSLAWTGNEYGISWPDDRDSNREMYFALIRCCDDMDSDGYSECSGDCNDADFNINPGAAELCDGLDNDCDGSIDDGCGTDCGTLDKPDPDERITNDPQTSYYASLAWTGQEYGISWYDNRDGNLEIYFARIDSYGNKIDSDLRITYDAASAYYPSLAWTGNEYAIAWRDFRDGNGEIYFQRIDSSGNAIGSEERVTFDSSNSYRASLVWTGGEYGLAWYDNRDGNGEIYFTRLDVSGNKIRSDIRVTNDPAGSWNPSLVWTGSEYGVAWYDFRDGNYEIYFARLSSVGSKIGSDLRVTSDSERSQYPSLTWSGSEYALAWYDLRDGNGEIYFARIDSAGIKIGSDTRVTNDSAISTQPALTWNGNEYGVAWHDERDGNREIYFVQLDSLGSKIGSDLRITEELGRSNYTSLVFRGNGYGIAWHDDRDGNNEIYLTHVYCCVDDDLDGFSECEEDCDDDDADIYPGASQICDGKNNDCDDPNWPAPPSNEFDSDSDNYFECSGDCDDADPDIYPGASQICDGKNNDCDDPNWPALPANEIDNDGDGYFECAGECDDADPDVYPGASQICDGKNNDCDDLNWPNLEGTNEYDDDSDTYSECGGDCDDTDSFVYPGAAEVLCNGIDDNCDGTGNDSADNDTDGYDTCGSSDPLNPDGLERDCNDDEDSIYPGATESCNGFDDDCDDFLDEDCDAVCDNPSKAGSDSRITNDANNSYDPSLAWAGNQYGLSWYDSRHGVYEIYFARLTPNGNRIGSEIRVTTADSDSLEPSLVWTGSGYGVCWYDYRDGNSEIYFAKLDATGNKIGSDIRITYSAGASYRPSLTWNGREFGVSWYDYRDGNYEIYFARLDFDGNKLGTDSRITNDSGSSYNPSLIWTGSEYGISWYDSRDGNYEIYFARLDDPGNKKGSDVRVTNNHSSSYRPSVSWTGNEYGISWYDNRDGNPEIYFARLDNTGIKLGSDTRVTNDLSNSYYPSLYWSGGEYAISWVDERDGNQEIYFAKLDSSGNKTEPELRITNDAAASDHPFMLWTGSDYGISWDDERVGSVEVYFAQLQCCDNLDSDAYTECEGDCDDNDPDIYPGASQICGDGKNNDCDDPNWPDLTGTNDGDDDSDTFTECDGDCDDSDSDIYPGASQICDGKNNDCDDPNWPTVPVDEIDDDSDTYAECAGECDDNDADIYPGAPQICDDSKNNDCDHPNWPDLTGTNEVDDDTDTYTECAGDCDDTNVDVFPGASQICDGVNNDCDDPNWPALTGTNEFDDDTDTITECAGDCDDADGDIYPGASQICDGKNNDCNDPDWPTPPAEDSDDDNDTYTECGGDCDDADGDTYSGASQICDGVNNDCDDPDWPDLIGTNEYDDDSDGHTECGGDCDDADPNTYKKAPEICDGKNNDCQDPQWPDPPADEADADSDTVMECEGDCDDADTSVYPGASQICGDSKNNDCDHPDWPDLTNTNENDDDSDTYTECDGDCDDTDADLYPGASQICDGKNNDCNDLNWPTPPAEDSDADSDTYAECEGDCDDADGDVYPGATQICDGKNNDCDDLNWPTVPADEVDDDSDTFAECQGDCDDADTDVYPGASQICDGKNNDCDDLNWPTVPADEVDDDSDTFAECQGDCDDADTDVYPGASQICDGKNNDCNDPNWPNLDGTNEFDNDSDTFSLCDNDCDDADADIYPGASQICDGKNNDCNDPNWPALPSNEVDDDSDTYAECEGDCDDVDADVYPGASQICDGKNNDCNDPNWPNLDGTNEFDNDSDTFSECGGDCDDADTDVYPGASQICDGKNNDCSDPNWPNLNGTNEFDNDSDTFSECGGDCDDADADIYPGASQICDGKNNDCNDPNWPNLNGTNESDDDTDTYTECSGDCDDADPDVYPGASQICDGKNNDCDDPNWPNLNGTNESDDDTDTYTECSGDCDDADPDVYPGASQICDGKNNDCNDPNWPTVPAAEIDDDLDTLAECAGDCDDADADVYPGASQICDGKNNDCNDPNWPDLTGTNESDNDLDTFSECDGDCDNGDAEVYPGASQVCGDGKNNDCNHPNWPGLEGTNEYDDDADSYTECSGDCNDDNSSINPDASESCNAYDDNCDGTLDESCDSECDNPGKYGLDIRITDDTYIANDPSLAWTGSENGVAWHDDRHGKNEVYFTRLDSSGNQIGSDIRLTYFPRDSYDPSLVWTGNGYGVSWSDYRDSNWEIYFARLDSSGNKIGSNTRITNDVEISLYSSSAWSGSEFGLTWQDNIDGNWEIYFTRLDISGNKIGVNSRITSDDSESRYPSLVWSGSEWAISWQDLRDGNTEIYFARIDTSGSKIGSDIRVTSANYTSSRPSLAWTGSEYGISWHDRREGNYEIYFTRLDSSGNKIGSDTRVTNESSSSSYSSLIWTGAEFGISWEDLRDTNTEIYFARIDSSGNKVNSDVRITNDPASSRSTSIAWTGADYGISWRDDRNTNFAIYYAKISCCNNLDGDTYSECDGDCDDTDADIYPGASQICDGKNNDCDDPNWPTVPSNEIDDDSDTYSECQDDCDDTDADIYPGASQICDGKNNDCNDPNWPDLNGTNEVDNDSDTYSECAGDCDDTDADIYPGASQICDGKNNDCDDVNWPTVPSNEIDDDSDTYSECQGDCDDADADIYPGASQICDGKNNDCDDVNWPTVPSNEIDDDSDTFAECAGDCDDTDADIYPGASQICDGKNNDCDDVNWPTVPSNEIDDDSDTFAECAGDCDDADADIYPGASPLMR